MLVWWLRRGDPSPPAAPTGFTLTRSGSAFTLTWDNPNDSEITGYQYRWQSRGPGTGAVYGDYTDWTDIAGSGATTTTYVDTHATAPTAGSYQYQLRAVNLHGGGAEATTTVDVT